MNNSRLNDLMTRRRDVVGLINRATLVLNDIDEEIRASGGNPEPDFSGAVKRLRDSGVLPSKQ
jgi:hypothetical protein